MSRLCIALYRSIGREVPEVRVEVVLPYTNSTPYKVISTEKGDANRVLKGGLEIESHFHKNYEVTTSPMHPPKKDNTDYIYWLSHGTFHSKYQ